jgi:hypothetical protein
MRRYWIVTLPVVALAAVASLSVAREVARKSYAGEPVSDVIFPPQTIPLEFSHIEHLRRDKVNCAHCHEDAPDSRSSLDNNIPGEDICTECHEIDRNDPDKKVAEGEPRVHCSLCHPGYSASQPVARVSIPPPNIKFNHKAHVDRKIRCQLCHGEIVEEEVGLATRDQLPKMMLCLQCHDDKEAPSACTTCHLAEGNGLMKSVYDEGLLEPSGVLRGDVHDMNWRRDHAVIAKQDDGYCANCHRKEFCVGCHNGSVKPMDLHGNDYVTLHTIDARRNNPDCSACHRVQTFCVGCHSRTGVAFDGKGGEFKAPFLTGDTSAGFHPSGWVDFGTRSQDHHSFEAQRNIKQCAACHREQFCTTCHSAVPSNAYRVNPHPAGWLGSRRCKALAKRAGRMCLRCHVDPAEVRCNCRHDVCSEFDA